MTVNNLAQLNYAYRLYSSNYQQVQKAAKPLSSGYRVNSAADDAAALAISEKMRGQINGLGKASENAIHASALVNTAEGNLDSYSSILGRMRDLTVQSSNATYTDSDRALLDKEFQALKGELDRLSSSTQFNGQNLLDGSLGGVTGSRGLAQMGVDAISASAGNSFSGDAKFTISTDNGVTSVTAQIGGQTVTNQLAAGDIATTFNFGAMGNLTMDFSGGSLQDGVISGVGLTSGSTAADISSAVSARGGSGLTFQIGANGGADQRLSLNIGDMSALGLGIADLDILSIGGANSALSAIDNAINSVNSERANLGATQNRLEHTISNLGTSQINMIASESTIRDADMAESIMNYVLKSIQMQASQAMMAQGMNVSRQSVMGLLMR